MHDKLQDAYNKLAVDDLDLKAEVANLKLLVTLLYEEVRHPKKAHETHHHSEPTVGATKAL